MTRTDIAFIVGDLILCAACLVVIATVLGGIYDQLVKIAKALEKK